MNAGRLVLRVSVLMILILIAMACQPAKTKADVNALVSVLEKKGKEARDQMPSKEPSQQMQKCMREFTKSFFKSKEVDLEKLVELEKSAKTKEQQEELEKRRNAIKGLANAIGGTGKKVDLHGIQMRNAILDVMNESKVTHLGSNWLLGAGPTETTNLQNDLYSQSQNLSQFTHLATGVAVGSSQWTRRIKWVFDALSKLEAIKSDMEDELKSLLRGMASAYELFSKDDVDDWEAFLRKTFECGQAKPETSRAKTGLLVQCAALVLVEHTNSISVPSERSFWKDVVNKAFEQAAIEGRKFPNEIDAFLAYEYISDEGIKETGLDSINDMIATIAGLKLAEDLAKGRVETTLVNKEIVVNLEYYLREGWKEFHRSSPKWIQAQRGKFVKMIVDEEKPKSFDKQGIPRTFWVTSLGNILKQEQAHRNAIGKRAFEHTEEKDWQEFEKNISETPWAKQMIEVFKFFAAPPDDEM